MKSTQAAVLLHIIENTVVDGDEIQQRMTAMRQECMLHAKRILEDEEMLIKAWELNQQDKERFMAYMPPEYRQQRGQNVGLGSNLTQQRTALAPVKEIRNEERQRDHRDQGNQKAQTGGQG